MERIEVGGISLEVLMQGQGPPLLFLHGGDYFAQHREFFDRLARRWRVVAPRHPGFGGSERPDDFRTVHDLAYLYLELLDRQDLGKVTLAGASFGGWIALEMCIRCLAQIKRLVLIDSVGVKFGGREERDIADIYALPNDELLRRTFFDPQRVAPDYSRLADDELIEIARDRQATVLYGWRPYMHNPGLRQWLRRVRVPALVIWGGSDGVVAPGYGEKLCRSLPDARFQLIREAGHYPQIERSDEVADAIDRFARAEVM
ncbi:MAG TPA: alpha/beta hydrolase [Stellaceae bacterium]|nr:alpha/beta hydrolase [Stellaceae bacterium]